jgi:hypothetical protein
VLCAYRHTISLFGSSSKFELLPFYVLVSESNNLLWTFREMNLMCLSQPVHDKSSSMWLWKIAALIKLSGCGTVSNIASFRPPQK